MISKKELNGMEVNRHALEMLLRTTGERFGEHVFPKDYYPRQTPNYPFNLIWNAEQAEFCGGMDLLDEVFTSLIRESINPVQDQKIGVLLSGGIDSSLLLYLTRREFPEADVTAVHTDWGKWYPEGIELPGAEKSAKFAQAPLEVIDGGIKAQIPYVQDALKNTLSVNYSVQIFYMTFDILREEGFDVVVGGNGLDSFFAGDKIHKWYFRKLGIGFLPLNKRLIKYDPYRLVVRIFGCDMAWFLSVISNVGIELIRNSGFTFEQMYSRVRANELWNTIQRWSVANAQRDASVAARAAWHHGLEIMYPFLKQPMVDLASSIKPGRTKNKTVIREYMEFLGFPDIIVSEGADWNKKGWGATCRPYFYEDYLDKVTPANPDLDYWLTQDGQSLYLALRETQSSTAYLIGLFFKILELSEVN